MCPCGQEGQRSPGVHQEECGQQVEGGHPPPILCAGEAASGVLCPVLGFPVQEGQGTAGESPVEGYRDDERTQTSVLGGKTERLGLFSLEKIRLGGHLTNAYKISKGQVSRGWGQTLISGAQKQDKRQRVQTGTQEIPSEHKEKLLFFEGGRALEQGVSIFGDIQNPPRCVPV
ncbi:hypothetical protein llap_6043 [Limosa lapponica baueri]|uniref:Uncharacterized protein n=1 Tax=Limosa lapponica baueri TaxID=1758121 RepID=A0A2I0UCA1_LIMLA|nr:hypothetical protein llap_6043 [Limosa lapponica baueri]